MSDRANFFTWLNSTQVTSVTEVHLDELGLRMSGHFITLNASSYASSCVSSQISPIYPQVSRPPSRSYLSVVFASPGTCSPTSSIISPISLLPTSGNPHSRGIIGQSLPFRGLHVGSCVSSHSSWTIWANLSSGISASELRSDELEFVNVIDQTPSHIRPIISVCSNTLTCLALIPVVVSSSTVRSAAMQCNRHHLTLIRFSMSLSRNAWSYVNSCSSRCGQL